MVQPHGSNEFSAEEILAKVGRIDLSGSSAWRQTQPWGQDFFKRKKPPERKPNRSRPASQGHATSGAEPGLNGYFQ